MGDLLFAAAAAVATGLTWQLMTVCSGGSGFGSGFVSCFGGRVSSIWTLASLLGFSMTVALNF